MYELANYINNTDYKTKNIKNTKFFQKSCNVWYLFSVYIDNFSNKSYLYGSLTALVIMMLWIYFCMIFIFLGGELNYFLMREKNES